jgi:hypothetical protein
VFIENLVSRPLLTGDIDIVMEALGIEKCNGGICRSVD